MTSKGADFSDIQPRDERGVLATGFVELDSTAGDAGVDNSVIQAVTPTNVFRLGQQVFFWLGIAAPLVEGNYLSRVRLKPWWARPNVEYRQAYGGTGQPGSDAVPPVDRLTFGAPSLDDNRYVWMPSPKRLDVTPFQTPPPPASPVRNSDSVFLDDIWTFDMPDPTDATYAGKFTASQTVSRWVTILYPAFGYALGFTYEATLNDPEGADVPVSVSLNWAVGTLGGGRSGEAIG